jgi:transaldolase/glucose-6-phosphate isomerase
MSLTAKVSPAEKEGKKGQNQLKALTALGQSVWLDYIRRDLITSGELARLISEDDLRGMTSNPSIFEKAIASSKDYAPQLAELAKRKDLDAKGVYEQIAINDIQSAADLMKSVYEKTKRRDGYVSLEVSPYLAHQTKETMEEARRLWKTVGRENVMIKVPGTPEGLPAIQQLLSEGININITLLFAQGVYEQVAEAFVAGAETFAKNGGDVSRLASVASFFVSRIDSLIDGKLADRIKKSNSASEQTELRGLQGKVAVANAKMAYEIYKRVFGGPRWKSLAAKGAQTQRVLWASTSTKNPAYPDTMYVDDLIGPDTVNTIPPATLDAFREHGHPKLTLETDLDGAHETMQTLEKVGVSMKAATDELTADGVKQFADAFDKLLAAVKESVAKSAGQK